MTEVVLTSSQPTEVSSSSSVQLHAPTKAELKKTKYADNALRYATAAIHVAQDVTSLLTSIPTPVGAALGAALCILRIVQVGRVICSSVSMFSMIVKRMVGNKKREQTLIKKIADLADAVNGAIKQGTISDANLSRTFSDLNE